MILFLLFGRDDGATGVKHTNALTPIVKNRESLYLEVLNKSQHQQDQKRDEQDFLTEILALP